ncbi:hypothetical protein [Schleiferilactobacillus shenzhenensis]|uniref:Uncharacterized protein n=1 Tax=Schleiferilactobacillus shenzhenensis LY-73 TaxID=1231336 RepID=U4TLS2_9LACO|nr:hypothetical protein [Schleiferilactobacillus shenzhenensis]ERL65169.1 hypothetical protein L248_2844 [Schleiferilactobacillus shenzhenensis LY-73]
MCEYNLRNRIVTTIIKKAPVAMAALGAVTVIVGLFYNAIS